MKERLLVCVALSVMSSWADAPLVKQLLDSALADSESTTSASTDHQRLDDALEALAPSDLESLLPAAMLCLRSTHPRAQQAGLRVLTEAALASTSSSLLDPYIIDFNATLSDSTNPTRQGVIAILALTRPSMSPKAIQLFLGHLQDPANTAEQTGMIAAGLLHAASSNQAIVHQVIGVAEKRSEYEVKYAVLQEIGLSKIQLPDALDLVGKELDDPNVRFGAIVAASRLDRDVRARFAAQLSRIAQDPDERPDRRGAAQAAISGH